MRMLQSILLATDYRPASQDAVRVTIRLASAFGSRVTLLHVLETESISPAAQQHEHGHAETALREIAGELAAQKITVAGSLIVTGPVADTIVRQAHQIDADLIVIGAGEMSQSDRFPVGAVAAGVLEHASQPVLAVRPGEPLPKFRKILCPVDQSGASARGVRNAVRLAQVFGGEIVVLTVVPPVSWLAAVAETGQFADARTEHEMKWRDEYEKFIQRIELENTAVTKEVRYGVAHEQIVAAAREHEVDLLLMGATGRTGLVRVLLGSTTRRVLQRLPCSLLVLKEEEAVEELFEEDFSTINLVMEEARGLLAAGSYPAALTRYRQVLGRNPFHLAALEGLAEVHKKLGRRHEAEFYQHRVDKLRNTWN